VTRDTHQDQSVDGPFVTQISAQVSDSDRKSWPGSDQGNYGGNCTETFFHCVLRVHLRPSIIISWHLGHSKVRGSRLKGTKSATRISALALASQALWHFVRPARERKRGKIPAPLDFNHRCAPASHPMPAKQHLKKIAKVPRVSKKYRACSAFSLA
jgi:hypothetical protein